jgi:hypothetical protein
MRQMLSGERETRPTPNHVNEANRRVRMSQRSAAIQGISREHRVSPHQPPESLREWGKRHKKVRNQTVATQSVRAGDAE